MKFNDLGLEPGLLSAVADRGYETPTPIQVEAIPPVLAGRDLLAGAQTGTGKTAAFVLPLLQLLRAAGGRAPRVLILAPTRELAAQILESIRTYGVRKNLRACVIFGGVGEQPQIDRLRSGCDILVATPGRLLDLANRHLVDLSEVKHFVLDEADRMLDMGFIHDIKRVIKLLPAQRQNLMFSATYTPDIRVLAARILVKPVQVEVTPPNSTVEKVVQRAFRVCQGRQAAPAGAPVPEWRQWRRPLAPGARFHAHQARRESAVTATRARRNPLRGDSRQQESGCADTRTC